MSSNEAGEPKQANIQLRWGVKIPLRDGVLLNATLYLPEGDPAPSPAIFTPTPYVAQSNHDRGVYFASCGYRFLAVDVRGRGNSEGEFHPLNEAKDGYDIVEWLARQPYCNGKVAMWGGSYMGHAQWATAKEFPPHLATIVPVAAPFRGLDSPMRNNIFSPYRMQWMILVAGRASQDKIFADQAFWNRQFKLAFESGIALEKLDSFLGHRSSLFQEWISYPVQGDYWDHYNPTAEQYAELRLPILTITGAYDGDQPGALMHYLQHMKHGTPAARALHHLVIGPWDHAGTRLPKAQFCGLEVGPASLVDLQKLHAEWYAWSMQGGPKPAFLRDNVAYYVMGADKWRYVNTLEEITTHTAPFYLGSSRNPTDVFHSGSLHGDPPASSEADSYRYDPSDVSLAHLESLVDPESRSDHRMVYASVGKQLVYHSAPFEKDVEISGFFKLSAWLSIDQPDTDFKVAVYEISLDGSALQLSTDWLRARYRENFRAPQLICSTEPLRYDFQRFSFISRHIKRGHRLRLVIGPINSIFVQKNYNSGGAVATESMSDALPVTVKLFHDESHPSVLHVPFGWPEDVDAEFTRP